jgi:hypothetical protein
LEQLILQKIYERFSQLQQLETEAAIALQWHPERVNHHGGDIPDGMLPRLKKSGFSCGAIARLNLHVGNLFTMSYTAINTIFNTLYYIVDTNLKSF